MSTEPNGPNVLARLSVATWAVTCVLGIIAIRGLQLQCLHGAKWASKRRENLHKVVRDRAMRGTIYDARGHVVASSCLAHDLWLNPHGGAWVDTHRIEESNALLLPPSVVERVNDRSEVTQPLRVARGIDIGRPGRGWLRPFSRRQSWVRQYPFGEMGAHAIGYLNEVSVRELAIGNGRYRSGDTIGRCGVEQLWETTLSGADGSHKIKRGRDASKPPTIGDTAPIASADLDLSLDMEVTGAIDRAFQAAKVAVGAAVVVEVRSGRLVALVSRPSVDPNLFSSTLSEATLEAMQRDPDHPQEDRTMARGYAPGSLFKPFAALAALEAGVDPEAKTTCTGTHAVGNRLFRCIRSHGPVNLREAIHQSCNTWFFEAAERVSIDNMARVATDFGLGERTGLGMSAEISGVMPTKAHFQRLDRNGFRLGHTLNTSIGQGMMRVTPLQIAMAYAAIFNGGTLFRPEVVARVRPPAKPAFTIQPEVRRRVSVAPERVATVANMVLTANGVQVEGTTMAGLMGSGQVPYVRVEGDANMALNRDHGWFAGVAPTSDPRWVVVVLAEHSSARSAREISQHAIRALSKSVGER